MSKGIIAGLRLTSLRLRLVVVFALVALTAAAAASGIAYWLNREAVLTRTQNGALNDFRQEMQNRAATLPTRPTEEELRRTAEQMASGSAGYSVLLIGERDAGKPIVGASDPDAFTLADVPRPLQTAVETKRPVTDVNDFPYHLFWQRTQRGSTPFLVGGTKIDGGGPTGYMFKSLAAEKADLNSLSWSLGIATGLAVIGSVLLAQVAAATVLRPVQRLGEAARQLGEGKLDTRLQVSGTDELADLSRTFNGAAESLQKRVADMSARDEASRRFVADMSHELRTPLTALTAVTEVLEDEQDTLDPMIAPAVALVVSETRRLNDLVENLMEVTRFDAGTARLVLDDVDIADQITACIDARAWLDAVDLDAERGIVARLDPRRLDVILANLIGNALKHGGSPVRVSVRTEVPEHGEDGGAGPAGGGAGTAGDREGDGRDGRDHRDGRGDRDDRDDWDEDGERGEPGEDLVIAVRDHGPGIPVEVLPHVFDRFYKASASRPRSEGSGLGLSIAMENALIHGGSISAANSTDEEGRVDGAVFVLRLPRDGSGIARELQTRSSQGEVEER